MIPIEFKKTTKHKEEFDNYMVQFEYEEIPVELEHLPPLELQREEYKASPEYKLKEKTKQSFSNEYKQLTEVNSYFLGCTYNTLYFNLRNTLTGFQRTVY